MKDHHSKTKNKKERRRVDGSPVVPVDTTRPVKRLILIRHGQSLGQVARANGWERKTDPRLRDCHLTRQGQNQARQLWNEFNAMKTEKQSERASPSPSPPSVRLTSSDWVNDIELVISSPLTRALQTALLAFQPHHPTPSSKTDQQSDDHRCHNNSNILVSYDIREIGSKIPENIPRDTKSVLQDLEPLIEERFDVINVINPPAVSPTNTTNNHVNDDDGEDDTSFLRRPKTPPPHTISPSSSSTIIPTLDVSTLRPKDWPRDSLPNVLQKDRIKSFLKYLYHDRSESCIAVVCHYNVIRSMVVENSKINTNNHDRTPTSSLSPPNSPKRVGDDSDGKKKKKKKGGGGGGGVASLRPENATPIYCYLYHNGDCCLA